MNEAELKAFSVRLAALADALEDRSHQAVLAVNTSGERLDQTAHQLSQNVQWLTSEATRAMGAQAHTAVTQGMQQAVERCAQLLDLASVRATQSAQALEAQHMALQRVQRTLVWRSGAALLVGAALVLGASGHVYWKSIQATRAADFSAAVLRAIQTGALTQCGDALCVKAPRSAPRYVRNNNYVLLP